MKAEFITVWPSDKLFQNYTEVCWKRRFWLLPQITALYFQSLRMCILMHFPGGCYAPPNFENHWRVWERDETWGRNWRKEPKSSQQEVKSDSLPTESRLALSLAMSNRIWRTEDVSVTSLGLKKSCIPSLSFGNQHWWHWTSLLEDERPCRTETSYLGWGYTKGLRLQLIHD